MERIRDLQRGGQGSVFLKYYKKFITRTFFFITVASITLIKVKYSINSLFEAQSSISNALHFSYIGRARCPHSSHESTSLNAYASEVD